jgi:hypothetical protein
MKICLRVSDKSSTCSGAPRPFFVKDKAELLRKCGKSLLNFKSASEILIFGDNLKSETIEFYRKIIPNATILNSPDVLGNSGTFKRVIEHLKKSNYDPDEVLLLTEDDYLYSGHSLDETVHNFYTEIAPKFNIPCFLHPTDYPDRYSDRGDLKHRLFLNNRIGYFREIKYTTFTYFCRMSDFQKMLYYIEVYVNHIPVTMCIDGLFSSIFHIEEALCFSPIPGMGAHLHQKSLPFYTDWEKAYSTA